MLRAVIPDPAPVKLVAVTVPVTSRAVAGFVFPMPTFPALLIRILSVAAVTPPSSLVKKVSAERRDASLSFSL
jgi:hypothetical protein